MIALWIVLVLLGAALTVIGAYLVDDAIQWWHEERGHWADPLPWWRDEDLP